MAVFLVLLIASVFHQVDADRFQSLLTVTPAYVTEGGRVTVEVSIHVNETNNMTFQVFTTNYTVALFSVFKVDVSSVGSGLRVPNTVPELSSSPGATVKNNAKINFGTVTLDDRNSNLIKIKAELQLVSANSAKANTEFWLGAGVTIGGKSIEVHECPVVFAVPSVKTPVLEATVTLKDLDDNGFMWADEARHEVTVTHAATSTEKAENIEVKVEMPSYMKYKSSTTDSASVPLVTQTTGGFKVTATSLDFSQRIKFVITHSFEYPSDVAVGSLLFVNALVTVSCTGSCSRRITNDPVVSFTKRYRLKFTPQDVQASVPDSNMTACSYQPAVGEPKTARLHNQLGWNPAWTDKNQWLQIGLPSVSTLTHMITQGAGKDQILKTGLRGYVKSFLVYHSLNGVTWSAVYRDGSTKLFEGNRNTQGTVGHMFNPAVTTRHVRINPQSWHQGIFLRTSLYGKPGTQSLSADKMYSRQILLDKSKNTFVFCNVDYRRLETSNKPSCFYTTGTTGTWNAFDLRVLNLVGLDTATRVVYGLDEKARSVMSANLDLDPVLWYAIPSADLDEAKKKSTFVQPIAVDHIAKTNTDADKSTTGYLVSATDGTKWGASPHGIYCNDKLVVGW